MVPRGAEEINELIRCLSPYFVLISKYMPYPIEEGVSGQKGTKLEWDRGLDPSFEGCGVLICRTSGGIIAIN